MKTKFNKSQIFKKAWSLFKIEIAKNQDNRTDQMFSECLKQAWQIAKTMPVVSIESLYKLHYGAIYNFINMKLHNVEVSEELTNDTFIKANNNMYQFNADKSKLLTWLYNIAKNCVIDYYRKDQSDKYINVSNFNDAETGKEIFQFADISDSQRTDTILENKELFANVQKAMSKLKPKYQKIAELHFIADKPYNEIAELLEMPLGSVKGTINRIKAMLTSQAELKYTYQNM